MKKIILISILLCISFLQMNAQWNVDSKRANKWHFTIMNNLNILDFSQANVSQLPTVDTSSVQSLLSYNNRSSMCDTSGNMLFYTNGVHIYDSTLQVMQYGQFITPGYSAGNCFTDGVLSLPMPKHDSLYYVFTLSSDTPCVMLGTQYIYYSVININLNNGKGAVISKSNLLFSNDLLSTGHIKACRHGNGKDWWLLIKNFNGNKFYRFLLDSSGVHSFQPQTIGTPFLAGTSWQAAFSSKGNKYAIVTGYGTFDHDTTALNIFNFDRCTGLLSNPIQYPAFRVDTFLNLFGICFSPNEQLMYWCNLDSIFQYNLQTNISTNVAVFDSSLVPLSGTLYLSAFKFSFMQLGPDGRIYIGTEQNNLNYIEHPDLVGPSCDVHKLAITLPMVYGAFLLNMPFYTTPPINCDSAVGVETEPILNDRVLVYPNPSVGEFTIEVTKANCEIQVYSILGEMIYKQRNAPLRSLINLTNRSNGLYLVKVMHKGMLLGEQKILKE